MRTRRPFAERTRTAIGLWMPLDGKQLALVMLVLLGALALGPFVQ